MTNSRYAPPALSVKEVIPSGSIRAPRQDAAEANHPITQRIIDRSVTAHSDAAWQSASRQAHPPLVPEPFDDNYTVEGGHVEVPPTQAAVSNIHLDTTRHPAKAIPHELTGEYPITDFDGRVHFKPAPCGATPDVEALTAHLGATVPRATAGLVKGYPRSDPFITTETTTEAAHRARGYFPGEFRRKAGEEYVDACHDAEADFGARCEAIKAAMPPPPPEAALWASTTRAEHNPALHQFVIREDVIRSIGPAKPGDAASPTSTTEDDLRAASMRGMLEMSVDSRRGRQEAVPSPVRALKARLGERAMVAQWTTEYRDKFPLTEEEFAIAQRVYETTGGDHQAIDRPREEIEALTVAAGRRLGAQAAQTGSVRGDAPDHHTHYTGALVAPAMPGMDGTVAAAGQQVRVFNDARGAAGLPALRDAAGARSRASAATGVGRRILEAAMNPRGSRAAEFAPRSFVRDWPAFKGKAADPSASLSTSALAQRRAQSAPGLLAADGTPLPYGFSAAPVLVAAAIAAGGSHLSPTGTLSGTAATSTMLAGDTTASGPLANSGRIIDATLQYPTGSHYGTITGPFDSSLGRLGAPRAVGYKGAPAHARGNTISGVAAAYRAAAAAAGVDEFGDVAPLYRNREDAEADRAHVDDNDTFTTTQREAFVPVSGPPAEFRKAHVFEVKQARMQMRHLHQPQRQLTNTTIIPDQYSTSTGRTHRPFRVDASVPII